MKKILLASVAALSLTLALPAMAQDVLVGVEPGSSDADTNALIGAGGGGAAGAAVGAVVGGPIGAIIGGFAGATLGGAAGVEASSLDYVAANPVEPIYFDGQADVGFVVPADVTVYPIQGDPAYGYIYANDRVWIVDMQTRALVQSPGYLVQPTYSDYVLSNPTDPVELSEDVVVGYVLPDDVTLTPVPQSSYSYVYIGDRPAMVDTTTRTVVWLD